MKLKNINTGSKDNDGTGDTIKDGMEKINYNNKLIMKKEMKKHTHKLIMKSRKRVQVSLKAKCNTTYTYQKIKH